MPCAPTGGPSCSPAPRTSQRCTRHGTTICRWRRCSARWSATTHSRTRELSPRRWPAGCSNPGAAANWGSRPNPRTPQAPAFPELRAALLRAMGLSGRNGPKIRPATGPKRPLKPRSRMLNPARSAGRGLWCRGWRRAASAGKSQSGGGRDRESGAGRSAGGP